MAQGSAPADGAGPPPAGLVGTAAPSNHSRHSTSPELNPLPLPAPAQRSSTGGSAGSPDSSGHRRRNPSFSGSPEQSSSPANESDSEDSELRKLEEEFQRNLQRAKKVFDNRMDNLQRSQIEREAQHKKTLEKHEQERAQFERRLAQEEEQQNRRLEQLQREWAKKRETLAQRKAHSGTNGIYVSNEALPGSSGTASAAQAAVGGLPGTNASQHSAPAAPAAVTAQVISSASAPADNSSHEQVDINGDVER